MHRYARDLLGYAVALFACYGGFVSVGLGLGTFSLIFLVLGISTALCVMLLGTTWDTARPRVLAVV